jgi:hypothetical protein
MTAVASALPPLHDLPSLIEHAAAMLSGAERRLADEYDAAQDRGEVQKPGGDRFSIVPDRNNAPTVTYLGLSRKDIHEARLVRDAERVDPGIVQRTLDEKLAQGEEPTRATLTPAASPEVLS